MVELAHPRTPMGRTTFLLPVLYHMSKKAGRLRTRSSYVLGFLRLGLAFPNLICTARARLLLLPLRDDWPL